MKIHRQYGVSELEAMRLADYYDMLEYYKIARRKYKRNIVDALIDWDLYDTKLLAEMREKGAPYVYKMKQRQKQT